MDGTRPPIPPIEPRRLLALAVLALALWLSGGPEAPAPGHLQPPWAPAGLAAQETPPRTQGQVVQIRFRNEKELQELVTQVDVWQVRRDRPGSNIGTLVAWVTPAQLRALQEAGHLVTPDPIRTAALRRPWVRSPGQRQGIPGFACYRTVEETYRDLADLAAAYPDIARLVDFGDTYDKVTPGGPAGYDLLDLVLTNRLRPVPEKGTLVVLAATHARELATAEVATRFAELLLAGYGRDPDLTWLLDFNEIHIIPYGNPDGRKWAEQGYLWRKNTDNPAACGFPYYGVDLNRNASFLWDVCPGCSSGDPCSIIYRGPRPGSEPETQALEARLRQVFGDFKGPQLADPPSPETNGIFLSLHSFGELIIYPWDWTGSPAPNQAALVTLGRKFGYYTGYAVCNTSNCLYAIDGSQTDYAYGQLGVATYTFELGTTFFQSCQSFESQVLGPNLDALRYAAKAAYRPYGLPAGPEVLDVAVRPTRLYPGMPLRVTARADDTRYRSQGYGVEPSQAIVGARVTLDRPGWIEAETAGTLEPADGAFDAPQEELVGWLDTTGWPPGRHTLFVQAQDADGNWGVPTAVFVWILTPEGLEVAVEPGTTLEAAPGETGTFTVTLTNRLAVTDTYRLDVLRTDWPVGLSRRRVAVPPGQTFSMPVAVSVPQETPPGTRGQTVLQIASNTVPFRAVQVTLQVHAVLSSVEENTAPATRPIYLPWVGGPPR